MAKNKLSVHDFQRMKEEGEQCVWVTAYDYPTASFAEEAGVDMILIGDSLGMVVLGYKGTEPVEIDDCIYHSKAVRRGAPNTWLIGDLPLGSYQKSPQQAVENAIRFLKEADMDCVKLEGGTTVFDQIDAISDAGVNVMGHIGLTPQSSGALGGFKAQGTTVDSAKGVIEDALAVQEAGAFSVLVEAVPPKLTAFLQKKLDIPVYGIGAGPCDGQVLICGDMLGKFEAFTPKFVKKYANVAKIEKEAFAQYVKEVENGEFPAKEHTYGIKDDPEEFEKLFDEYK